MADILSQEEVDSLLAPLDEDKVKKEVVGFPDDIASLKAEVIKLRILLQRYEKMKDDLRDAIDVMLQVMLVNDPIINAYDEVQQFLNQPIADLKIDLRLRQKLETNRCSTIGDLCCLTKGILKQRLRFTNQEIEKIKKALDRLNLYLVG